MSVNAQLTDTPDLVLACVWLFLDLELLVDRLGEFRQLFGIREINSCHGQRRVLHDSFTVHVFGVVGVHFGIGAVLVVSLRGCPHCDAEFPLHGFDLYLPLLPSPRFGLGLDDVDAV